MRKNSTASYILLTLIISILQPLQAKNRNIPIIEFKQAKVQDAVGMLAEIANINIAATHEAGQYLVTFRMKDTSDKGIIDTIARVSGLWYRYIRSTDSYLLMTAAQYQSDIVVFRDDLVRTFELRHQNVEAAAKTIRNIYGERVILTLEYKNDDFEGLPFEDIEDATVSNSDSQPTRASRTTSSSNRNNNQQNGAQQDTSTGENGKISGEKISTLDSFAQDKKQQKILTSGQLNSLQGQQQVNDQQVAKVTDAQTPIYVTINRIHNLLFVRTTDEAVLKEIAKLIEVSDKPTPQVLLEMEIIEIKIGDSYDQEFELSFNSAGQIDNFSFKSSADDAATTSPQDVKFGNLNIDLSEETAANYALPLAALLRGKNVQSLVTGASGGVYQFLSQQVNAKIELLKTNGQARTLSKPVVLASNNRQAKIFIGDEQIIATGIDNLARYVEYDADGRAISSSTAKTQVETERRKVGNTLYLLPSINADRTVTIDILQDQSKVVRNGTKMPYFDDEAQEIKHQAIDAVSQSSIKTVVVAKDGLTIALGGMVRTSTSLETSKVPLLGDIPFIGTFFTSEHEVNSSYQYIMLITPHIIMSPEEAGDKSREISGFDYDKNANHSDREPYPDYGFDRYIELTQFALTAISDNRFNQQSPSITPVDLTAGSASAIFPIHGISAKIKAVWQQEQLFVSAFEVKNHTPISQQLHENQLRGTWLAATLQDHQLKGFGQEHSATWLYLVSEQPYQQVLKQLNDDHQ